MNYFIINEFGQQAVPFKFKSIEDALAAIETLVEVRHAGNMAYLNRYTIDTVI